MQRRGEIVANKYRIERLIAQGGMGAVYLATQLALLRRVALKVLAPGRADPTFQKRFFLEASTYARLEHRHVVTVYDFGRTPTGELYIAMEFLRGTLLSDRLTVEGPLEPSRAINVAKQLAWGLRAAHRKGVIHRDLKPSNVMLLEDGDADGRDFAKLLDFGIAKVVEPRPNLTRNDGNLTQDGTWVGSPRYMSPEQIQCGTVDARTDIYSFGIVLYEICTGQHPFTGRVNGRGIADLLRWHLTGVMPHLATALPDWPYVDRLDAVIHRCAEKDPADRYQSMGDVIRALGLCLESGDIHHPEEFDTGVSAVQVAESLGHGEVEEAPYRARVPTYDDDFARRSHVALMAEQASDEAALLRLAIWIAVLAIPLSAMIVLLLVTGT